MRAYTSPVIPLVFVSVLWLTACSGGGGSPTAPDMQMPPGTMPGSASFEIVGSGQDQVVSYGGGGNLVFCSRDAGWASLFIRFAEQNVGNGGAGPHLDIDLCAHAGGGTFSPKDPRDPSCGGAKTWDIWWHGADGSVFTNQASSPGCTLQISQSALRLSGSFQCRSLLEDGGSRTIDVVNGSFDCTET